MVIPAVTFQASIPTFTRSGTVTVRNVAAFADKIGNDPVFFPLLYVFKA